MVAIDAKRMNNEKQIPNPKSQNPKWEVYVSGGRVATGLDAIEWAKKVVALGAGEILLTSIDADGTKNGYDLELTRRVAESVNVPIIASGGADRSNISPMHARQSRCGVGGFTFP